MKNIDFEKYFAAEDRRPLDRFLYYDIKTIT